MEDFTATPETGPVDASMEDIRNEFLSDAPPAPDVLAEVREELVNEAEGTGDAEAEAEAPATEDDATEPAEEAEQDDSEATQEEATYTVKVNGEELQVPLSELVNGYSRTTDYKQKTAEVAEQRRQVEARAASYEADLKTTYANQLEEATRAFAETDPVLMEARTINWEALKATDPAAFVQASDAVNARLAQIEAMQQRVATARQEAQQQQANDAAAERAQRFDAAADAIVKANPELAEEGKFQEFAGNAIGHLRDLGFSNDEIAESLDHRVLTLADKARRWDAHEASLKSLPEKKVVAKSAVKPLASDGSGSRTPAKRLPSNASREARTAWARDQLLSEG